MDPDYLLLTPGPLSITASVRAAMDRDVSTWDVNYNSVVEQIRSQLVSLVAGGSEATSVLMQGSGGFGVEATPGTVVPRSGGLQSPIITAFHDRVDNFDFVTFYDLLKQHGFVMYPGQVTQANTFRIGTIGDVHTEDIQRLLSAVSHIADQMGLFSESTAAGSEAGP